MTHNACLSAVKYLVAAYNVGSHFLLAPSRVLRVVHQVPLQLCSRFNTVLCPAVIRRMPALSQTDA